MQEPDRYPYVRVSFRDGSADKVFETAGNDHERYSYALRGDDVVILRWRWESPKGLWGLVGKETYAASGAHVAETRE